MLKQQAISDLWPDDARFNSAWKSEPLYYRITRARLRTVLEALELQIRASTKGKAEEVNLPKNLTIEHLLPQGWHAHWPLPEPTP